MRRLIYGGAAPGLWILFFPICLGLGYPTLSRYDSRVTGNIDSSEYYTIVEAEGLMPVVASEDDGPRPRMLVPLVAKVFYRLTRGHTGTADPVFLGLLLANSLFVATTALLLVDLGSRMTGNRQIALLAGALYLLSFAVPNYLLSGLVDSGEACMIMVLAWAMYTDRWYLLPVAGVFGVMSKETFLPFSAAFTFGWWVVAAGEGASRRTHLAWILAKDATVLGALIVLWSAWYGHLTMPWDIARTHQNDMTFFSGLWRCVTSHEFFYVFGWLAPLGIWRLHRVHAPWVAGALAGGFVALVFGAWDDSHGNISRAMFNLAGPVLSLSVAILVTGITVARVPSEHQ